MKTINPLFITPALAFLSPSCIEKEKKNPESPNIILILMDDMGYSDIGFFGSEIKTPNIDRLATEGYVMTNFYNAGRCCPSRASLITGLYQHQVGVGDMLRNDQLPGYTDHLRENCITIPEILEIKGYANFISGKWHLGAKPEYWPMKRGFHRQYASNGTTGHYWGIAKGRDYVVEDTLREAPGEWIESGATSYKLFKNSDGSQWYATDAYTDRAINYITELRQEDSKRPFFLYLPYTAPHWPLHAWEEDIQKYKGVYDAGWDNLREARYRKMLKNGILDEGWPLSERNMNVPAWEAVPDSLKEWNIRLMEVYAAMIDRADQNIGRLIEFLENNGELDNTVIFFLSDNGGCHEAPHRGRKDAVPGSPDSFDGYGYPWANLSNTPFKWYKHWVHEGGISTPFIAWRPGTFKSRLDTSHTGHIIDLLPTIADLAEAEIPNVYRDSVLLEVEGQSLMNLLTDKGSYSDHENLFWEHEGNRAVRQGDYKLVSRFNYKENRPFDWELYNVKVDRSEIRDLSSDMPDKVMELKKLYMEWAEKCNVLPYKELNKRRGQLK